MKMLLSIIYCVVAYIISLCADYAWMAYVVTHVSFSTYLGVISIDHLFVWLPDMILYGLLGFYLTRLLKTRSKLWLLIVCVIVFILEIYFVSHIFTEHAEIADRIWAYLGYAVPSSALFIGYQLRVRQIKSELELQI